MALVAHPVHVRDEFNTYYGVSGVEKAEKLR